MYATRTLIGINVVVMIISIATGGSGAVAGGGWGGLLGASTPLTEWGAVLGYAPYARRLAHGIAPASGTAWSPRCSCTTACCTCC